MTDYESTIEVELPPASLVTKTWGQHPGASTRDLFVDEVRDKIREHAEIVSEVLENNAGAASTMSFTVRWEVDEDEAVSAIHDLYDLATSVKELETELLSMHYSGYPSVPKPELVQ